MMNNIILFVRRVILEGKIPYLFVLKKIILFVAFVPLIVIFFFPENYRDLGEFSWNLLVLLLLLRPASEIFVDFKVLKALMPLRKEGGILVGTLGIAHSIGYFLNENITLPRGFFADYIWDLKGYFFWGMIGCIIAVILTLTSNTFSVRYLKSYWKKLHRLTYVLFFVVAIHIILINAVKEGTYLSFEVWKPLVLLMVLGIFWILSAKKIKISF